MPLLGKKFNAPVGMSQPSRKAFAPTITNSSTAGPMGPFYIAGTVYIPQIPPFFNPALSQSL